MPKWKDYTGFENEYIKVLGRSSEEVQIERNKGLKNKAEYWDTLCKACGNVFVANKQNIPHIHSCGCGRIHCLENAKKEIGKTYNHLTIVGIDEERSMQRNACGNITVYCFAVCDCSPSIVRSYNLSAVKSGHVKSCGCSKFNNPLILEDLTGQTFNRLTVVGRDIERDKKEIDEKGTRRGNAHWLCSCSCGNPDLVSVAGNQLKSGGTKSCGCLVSEMLIERNKRDSCKYNRPEKYKDNKVIPNEDGSIRVYDENMEYSFLVDAEDYEYISKWYWRKAIIGDNPNKWYWVTNEKEENMKNGGKTQLRLHQLIAERKYGSYDRSLVPDHLSRDPDDNRRCNLILKSNMENSHNRKRSKTNTSGKTGVYRRKDTGNWTASITVNYKTIYLGEFKNYEDAVRARLEAEQKYGFTCDDIRPEYDYKYPKMKGVK